MAEAETLQAVVTGLDELVADGRVILKIGLFNPDGTPYAPGSSGGGNSGLWPANVTVCLPEGSLSTDYEPDDAKIQEAVNNVSDFNELGLQLLIYDGYAAILVEGHNPQPAALSEHQPVLGDSYICTYLIEPNLDDPALTYNILTPCLYSFIGKIGQPGVVQLDIPTNRVTSGTTYITGLSERMIFDVDNDIELHFSTLGRDNGTAYRYRIDNRGSGTVIFSGVTIDGVSSSLSVPSGGVWELTHLAYAPKDPAYELITDGIHT